MSEQVNRSISCYLSASRTTVAGRRPQGLAETTIGLYKVECTRSGSPFRTGPFARLSDIERATSL